MPAPSNAHSARRPTATTHWGRNSSAKSASQGCPSRRCALVGVRLPRPEVAAGWKGTAFHVRGSGRFPRDPASTVQKMVAVASVVGSEPSGLRKPAPGPNARHGSSHGVVRVARDAKGTPDRTAPRCPGASPTKSTTGPPVLSICRNRLRFFAGTFAAEYGLTSANEGSGRAWPSAATKRAIRDKLLLPPRQLALASPPRLNALRAGCPRAARTQQSSQMSHITPRLRQGVGHAASIKLEFSVGE